MASARESIGQAQTLTQETTAPGVAEQLRLQAQSAFLAGFHPTIMVSIVVLAAAGLTAAVLLRPRAA
ncbi:hypothetical protein ACX9NE_15365 [Mycobacterium sp. ML4]